ncbi:MAG: hypothetical protein CMN32_08065 [Saprospirales bacterium]|nr:hypothetical protein [Saprospirales bacterium]
MALCSFGQTDFKKPDIVVGPKIKESKKMLLERIVAYDGDGLFAVKKKSAGLLPKNPAIFFEYVDASLSPVIKVKFKGKYQGKRLKYEGVVVKDGKPYVLASGVNNKQKKRYLCVNSFSKETLQPTGEWRKIAEFNYTSQLVRKLGKFGFRTSQDSARLLVYYTEPYQDDETEKFSFAVFDADFNKLWGREVELPASMGLFNVEDYGLDNMGNVYFLGKEYEGKRSSLLLNIEKDHKYTLLSFTAVKDSFIQRAIKFEGKLAREAKIFVRGKGDVICTGFYAHSDVKPFMGNRPLEGVFVVQLQGEDLSVEFESTKEFDIDLITQSMFKAQKKSAMKREADGGVNGLFNYKIKNILNRQDGGVYLIAEHQYTVVSDSRTKPGELGGVTVNYVFKEILVTSLSSNFEVEWIKMIPKSQSGKRKVKVYSSFFPFLRDDKLYLIYLDYTKSVKLPIGGYMAMNGMSKKAITILVTCDPIGNIEKYGIATYSDVKVWLQPVYSTWISDNELIMYGSRKRSKRYIKLKLFE